MRALVAILVVLMPAWALADDAPDAGTQVEENNSAGETQGEAPPAEAKQADNPLAKAVQARTPEAQALQSGFQLITAVDHYLGTGTFVDPDLYASLIAYLTVIPQYLFGVGNQRLVLSGSLRFVWEYSMPDNAMARRWDTWDTAINLSAPAMFRFFKGAFDGAWKTGISLTPSVGITVPTSLASWNAGLIGGVRAGLTLSSSVGIVDFRANVTGTRNIHAQQQSGIRNPALSGGPGRDQSGNLLAVCRPGEQLCGVGGNNVAWLLSAGGQIQVRATGSLLFFVGYTYIMQWRYPASGGVDEYTPPYLTSDGNPAAQPGAGRFDRTSAYFGASYQVNEHYSVDLGASTIQTPLVVDANGNWSPRFPFWATTNTNDNATSIFFSFTAAY